MKICVKDSLENIKVIMCGSDIHTVEQRWNIENTDNNDKIILSGVYLQRREMICWLICAAIVMKFLMNDNRVIMENDPEVQ